MRAPVGPDQEDGEAAGPSESIAWVVFGDDWGRHPSTTQHLVAHLPRQDRVTWVDSLGMRAPRLAWRDARRIAERLTAQLGARITTVGAAAGQGGAAEDGHPARRVQPLVLPSHDARFAVAVNRRLLGRALDAERGAVALVANPMAEPYLDGLAPRRVLYLRLDRYEDVPGVDAALVRAIEPALIARADAIFAPNARIAAGLPSDKTRILPQGVALERFAAVPLEPPRTRVCGYWGWLGEWLDQDLVRAVAHAHPDWTFELRGPSRLAPGALRLGSNVMVLPAVPHEALAQASAHWQAAWAPFKVSHHMAHASPLKLREYLAAGFPSASTGIPEALDLDGVDVVGGVADVSAFLARALADSAEARVERRRRVADASWEARAAELRRFAR